MDAPASTSCPMMRRLPRWAATCIGAQPRWSAIAGSALCVNRTLVISKFCCKTAWCSAVAPRALMALISKSARSHKSWTIAMCPSAAAAKSGGRGLLDAFTCARLSTSSFKTSSAPLLIASDTARSGCSAEKFSCSASSPRSTLTFAQCPAWQAASSGVSWNTCTAAATLSLFSVVELRLGGSAPCCPRAEAAARLAPVA
mmetsp:Transcript_27981/g.64575  ORF Transcript_27981/g.64575 Transcript_27981/m.64575 type:complete len:200 (-) Transcript_27981:251-850(-)